MLKPLIELNNLSRTYREGQRSREAVRSVSLTVGRGEIIALLGRSGSGKSTLLNLIGGIDLPTDGDVVIDGRALNQMDEYERTLFRRRQVGFIYQFFNLIPTLTVLENVRLPLELNSLNVDRADRLLDQVGLADRRDTYPDRLSGGEQQRVAIARALVHEPAVLLADEPTGNLDAESGRLVLGLLGNLVREHGATLVLVTHSRKVAELADRIFVLDDGCLTDRIDEVIW
ncbi:MAG: ABC transporter ATP-binding protein [Halobacteria archaeon]|nr:ABC transporter ATP-binding protein [Halobacteria archaeon]